MLKFRVSIHGENFLMKSSKKESGKMSFDTIRYVEARDEEAAEVKAIQIMRSDSHLRNTTMNDRNDPPIMYVDSVIEIEDYDPKNLLATAFRFYPDDGSGSKK